MSGRDQRIYEEANALWRALFGEPPPGLADGPDLLDAIIERLSQGPYERLVSPHLRPSQIAGPRPRAPL